MIYRVYLPGREKPVVKNADSHSVVSRGDFLSLVLLDAKERSVAFFRDWSYFEREP